MEPRPQSPTHDRDLDFDPRPWPAAPRGRPPLYRDEVQRLIANPFLGLFSMIVLHGVLREAIAIKSPLVLGVFPCGMLVLYYTLHYHCRDCGSTGLLFRWRAHACPSVVARQQTGWHRRFRGPNPYTQMILWIYLLAGAAILLAVVLRRVGP